jgi:RND superfamily putative drug exporter
MNPLPRFIGRVRSPLVFVAGLLLAGLGFALIPAGDEGGFPDSGLADTAESRQVAALLEDAPSADSTAGILLFSRDDGAELDAADLEAIAAAADRLSELATDPFTTFVLPADDGSAALVVVALDRAEVDEALPATADELRETAADGLPSGIDVRLTGPVGFQADIANAFEGADLRLLLITAIVVGVLLIITYRSPVLWVIPLLVVGVADGLARIVVTWLAPFVGLEIDPSVSGIQSVLVFGAGTNYALLLVARYREELFRHADRFDAMRVAVRQAGPAILASGATVAVSLLLLLVGELSGNRALGFACAVGIVIALIFGLLVLPSALVIWGRGIFWPFTPKYSPEPWENERSVWGRIGTAVSRRPVVVTVTATALILLASAGLFGAKVGLSQTDQIIGNPESVQAQAIIERSFSAGLTATTQVVVPADAADETVAVVEGVSGVDSARLGETWDDLAVVEVVLDADPQSSAAFTVIRDLRAELGDQPGDVGAALVGGTDATALDVRDAAARDQALILPLIALVVFLILTILLRSAVAPIILVATVITTFLASLGASNLIFQNILGFPAFDTSVVLFGFLFLVALGVDYNIFLVTRAREERALVGDTTHAMIRALRGTGAVITSAGILLAAVFVVLGVLPVVALAQIGVIVCIGVLLDTLVVRTVLVPAITFMLGDRFWWPRRPRKVEEAVKA